MSTRILAARLLVAQRAFMAGPPVDIEPEDVVAEALEAVLPALYRDRRAAAAAVDRALDAVYAGTDDITAVEAELDACTRLAPLDWQEPPAREIEELTGLRGRLGMLLGVEA